MTKAELKAAWGKYCDTDELVDEIRALLTEKRIRNSVNGICEMLNVFFTNKADIIEMMQNSDNYVGDLRIVVSTQMRRYNNLQSIGRFMSSFYNSVEAEKIIFKDKDSEGKCLNDYIKIGKTKVTIDDIVNNRTESASFGDWYHVFDNTGITRESMKQASEFRFAINCFNRYASPVVNQSLHDSIITHNANIKIAEGTKTSRAFNKVCHAYGVDSVAKGIEVKIASGAKFTDGSEVPNEAISANHNVKSVDGNEVTLTNLKKTIDKKYLSNVKYNKLFAEYADMVTEAKRNIKFYISVNPIDYLTMSVGRSWTSCHAFGGGYFGGTVSYMLDHVSIITFVHDEVPSDFASEGKIYRNMFHYKDGTLLQSRVYPQGNDGCTDLYEEFRKIMQKEMADMLGVNNNWDRVAEREVQINSVGNHYKDYRYFRNGINMSKVHGTNCRQMLIGHTNICPNCGQVESLPSHVITHGGCTAL